MIHVVEVQLGRAVALLPVLMMFGPANALGQSRGQTPASAPSAPETRAQTPKGLPKPKKAVSKKVTVVRFSSVAALLAKQPPVRTIVEVSGIIKSRCDQLESPVACSPANFELADAPYVSRVKAILVLLSDRSELQKANPSTNGFYKLQGVILSQASDASQPYGLQLTLGLHQITPAQRPPSPEKKPTYPDGSWSIDDLLMRQDLRMGTPIRVKAYVTSVIQCQSCLPPIQCQPCFMETVTLGDSPTSDVNSLLVFDYPFERGRPTEGKRYQFIGTFQPSTPGFVLLSGGAMTYQSHELLE